MHYQRISRLLGFLLALGLLSAPMFGATTPQHKKRAHIHKRVVSRSRTAAHLQPASFVATPHHPVSHLSRLPKKHYIMNPWTEPTFGDSTAGDLIDGEDLVVRRAAVQALGPFNGSIVVADPTSGRVLSIVNQKLAYKDGFEPCSTAKLVASLAGLSEGIINPATLLQAGTRRGMTLTDAIAHSNNPFFYGVGEKLGYDRIAKYARLFGYGEKASTIDEEQPSSIADAPPADGPGMMTVFGLGIEQTPLQLAALVSAIANGGDLYYLQHPKSQDEIAQFVPRLKRHLDIEQYIPYMKPGMMGAVEFGTARRAAYNPNEPIFGKTGTCTDNRVATHLGWFGSFNEVGSKKIVVVVLLTGGKPVNGPVAAGVAGAVYKNLSQENYFGQGSSVAPVALLSTQE
jgi:penicillin-binding protein 2